MTVETTVGLASQLATGFAPGLLTSAVFFAGLALGIRAARAARYPTMVLLMSAGARFTLLLGVGIWVAQLGVRQAVGFATAFVLLRIVAIALMTTRATTRTATSDQQATQQGDPDAVDTG